MKIYLDTNTLIEIFENSNPCKPQDFDSLLRSNGHELILSSVNIFEISAPLLNKGTQTNVMFLLNRIEEMPIRFITNILNLELKEGLAAFNQNREYCQVSPFVDRFDETLSDIGHPPTKIFLTFGLAETVFDLWTKNPKLFDILHQYTKPLQRVFELDRELTKPPALRHSFTKTIERALLLNNIEISPQQLAPFAEWIYKNIARCPSIRLGFEVYHKMVKNIGDTPKDGDIGDFKHIHCIPYVDVIPLDSRMHSYANQASRSAGFGYEIKIYKNAKEVLAILSGPRNKILKDNKNRKPYNRVRGRF